MRDENGVRLIEKPHEITVLEQHFSTGPELEGRYERALKYVQANPTEGWLSVVDEIGGFDIEKLTEEDGKIINLQAMLDGLTEAAQQAVKGPYPLRIDLIPLDDTHELSTTRLTSRIESDVCVVTMEVVPSFVESQA